MVHVIKKTIYVPVNSIDKSWSTNLFICKPHDIFIHHVSEIFFRDDADVGIVDFFEEVGQCVEVGVYRLPHSLLHLVNRHQCLGLVPHLLLERCQPLLSILREQPSITCFDNKLRFERIFYVQRILYFSQSDEKTDKPNMTMTWSICAVPTS